MKSLNRLVILSVAAAVFGFSSTSVNAQTKEARGTVTAVTETTLTVKAGAEQLTFYVDGETHMEVRSSAKRIQQEQPGNPRPRVNDFFEPANVVQVRYREESGRNHALDIARAGSAGAGGGSVSQPEKIAEGKVTSVTPSRLTIAGDGREFTFAINGKTEVIAKGATRATNAAGGNTPFTTFIHSGDLVSVSYKDAAGALTAEQVRLRAAR